VLGKANNPSKAQILTRSVFGFGWLRTGTVPAVIITCQSLLLMAVAALLFPAIRSRRLA